MISNTLPLHKQNNTTCDAFASCYNLKASNRSMHLDIDVDTSSKSLDCSIRAIIPTETFRSGESGDSGNVQTYNPAADRQVHLHIRHVSFGTGKAPECQCSGISHEYLYPKGLLSL
jgi:hypothetical protein